MGLIRPGVGDLLNTARCLDTVRFITVEPPGQITKADTLIVELIRISEDTRQPWMDWGSVESSNEFAGSALAALRAWVEDHRF